MSTHHAVFDAWSMGVLVHELAELLADRELPPAPSLVPADVATWERRRETAGGFDASLEWWHRRLEGFRHLALPIRAGADPDSTEEAGAEIRRTIPRDVTSRLAALGRKSGLTPFMSHLGLFESVLARWCGADDLILGTLVSGRDRPGTEGMIGMFVNEVVLRTDLGGQPGPVETMRRVGADVREAFARQDVPFPLLVRALKPPVRLGRNPLFDVLFQMRPFPPARLEAGPLRLAEREVFAGAARYDLFLELTAAEDGTICRFEYRTAQFHASQIEDLADRYLAAVDRAIGG